MSELEKDQLVTEIRPKGYITDEGMFKVEISIYDMFDEMHEEQLEVFAEHFGWGYILREAMRRLVGDSKGGSWSGSDNELRLEFLAEVESHLLKWTNWSSLLELRDAAREIKAYGKLFRAMRNDEKDGKFFCKWLNDNDFHFYTHNEEVKDFEDKLQDTFKEFSKRFEVDMEDKFGTFHYLSDEDYRVLSPTKSDNEKKEEG